MESVCNLYFLGTIPLLSTSQLLAILLENPVSHCLLNGVYTKLFGVTSHYLSHGCAVVQPKHDQLDIDVVDHSTLPVKTRVKKCFFVSMMDVAVAVYHAQFFYYYGRIDQSRERPLNNYSSLQTDAVP